jgi:uncharacterized membrane protein YidH (DUF202 family)
MEWISSTFLAWLLTLYLAIGFVLGTVIAYIAWVDYRSESMAVVWKAALCFVVWVLILFGWPIDLCSGIVERAKMEWAMRRERQRGKENRNDE